MKKTKSTQANSFIDTEFNEIDINLSFDIDMDDTFNVTKKDKISNLPKELKDEIIHFREKRKEYEATNNKDTYIILVFSTNEDKRIFAESLGMKKNVTLADGYEIARLLDVEPKKPKIKLRPPF